MEWSPPAGMTCLVGAGDSGKTSILEAIELGLWPRNWYQFIDSDFYGGSTEEPIEIEVTAVDFPRALLDEQKFGGELRGWTPEGKIRDEPEDED